MTDFRFCQSGARVSGRRAGWQSGRPCPVVFRRMKAVAGCGALGALMVCAALAAPAQATIRQGAGSDPAGDSTGGSGTDITAIAGKSDDTGAAAVAIQTSSASWSQTWLVGVLGTM